MLRLKNDKKRVTEYQNVFFNANMDFGNFENINCSRSLILLIVEHCSGQTGSYGHWSGCSLSISDVWWCNLV